MYPRVVRGTQNVFEAVFWKNRSSLGEGSGGEYMHVLAG